MKNILLALELDYKELTKDMIASAKQLAKAFGAKCWLVHIAAPEPDFMDYEVGPQYIRDMLAKDLKDIHKNIQTLANSLKEDSIDAEGLVIQGPTTEMIIEEVKKLSIDLLVLGNKKHGFMYNALIGSTTDELIDNISVPVLLIPEKK